MRISRWFLEITLDSETLRWCTGASDLVLGGDTYTGLGTRWSAPKSLKRKSSLKSEKLTLEFDSSRQSDNSDAIGHLLDQKWRRRAIRLRRIVWDAGDDPDDGDVMEDERGRIKNLSDSLKSGKPATLSMEIESGALAYLERRRETRTPASQQAAFPGDNGFGLIAQLEGVTLPWRTKHTKVGTVQLELQEEYEPYPRELALGRFATSGSFVAAFTNGQQRKYLQRVYAIADHRINKLDKVWVNGDLARNGALTHGTRTQVNLPGNSEARCWMTFYDGRPDQTADSYLVSAASTWTTNHRLRGVAYIIIEHLWDSDLPESFDYRFGGEGALLYDRRKDTTAGGTGSHRWDDPSTWEYSANAMVAADHYRSGIRIMSGSNAMWFGVGEAVDAVPYSEFEELADHCDEDVALKTVGTQKRYEVNGLLSADDDHAKNLQKIAEQMAARAIDQGGRISIRPPIVRTPVITLTDGDVVRDSESQADPGAGLDDMVNTISGRFINPDNDYKRDDFPAVQVSDYVNDDNGEISDTLNLDLETSAERAQRIAKLTIEDSRRVFELEETYGPQARVIAPGEWFVRESAIRGFPDGKTFIAEDVERFIDGSIRVRAREVDPDQLVWDEETAVDLSVPPAFPQVAIPNLTVPSIVITPFSYSGGGAEVPALRFTHAAFADFIGDEIEVEFGVHDGAGGITGQSAFGKFPGDFYILEGFIGLPPSITFAMRFRARLGERYSDWSDFQTFTTTSVYESATSGLADSFVGQNWGATASEAQASNSKVPYGVNLLTDSDFKRGTQFWPAGGFNNTGLGFTSGVNLAGPYFNNARNVYYGHPSSGTPALGTYATLTTQHATPGVRFSVQPGERLYARMLCAMYRAAWISGWLFWFDKDGVNHATDTEMFASTFTDPNGAYKGATFGVGEGYAIVPADAVEAAFFVRGYFSGDASPFFFCAEPFVCRVPDGHTATGIPYNPGRPDPKADVTIDHTAGAIEDQGNLATSNMSYQETEPSSPSNGDFWGKPDDTLYYRDAGEWVPIADLGGGALTGATASTTIASGISGTIPTVTESVTVTPQGGDGTYTYAWTKLSGDDVTVNSPTSATTTFQTAGENARATYVCTVTEASTGRKAQVAVGVAIDYIPPP
jgi:hypothetical protein